MPKPKIIFQNEDFLVLDKPSGMSVHGDGKTEEYTVADWLLENFPEIKSVGEPLVPNGQNILRPGIVHRLDKETSGVMVVAKTKETYEFLKQQFKERNVKKIYIALVYGNPKQDDFMVDRQIGRSKNDFRKRVTSHTRGEIREAITYFRVLKRFEKYALVEARPKTGRTHQIRVHLTSVGYPVVCDRLYAPKQVCPLQFGRLMLHAKSISFKGSDDVDYDFKSEATDNFLAPLDNIFALC